VLAAENTAQVGRFLDRHHEAAGVPVDADWGHACEQGRQIFPGEDTMDGFYFACVRKRS
jgi:16S rRNA (cytosine967-C5)-methyltransferase